MVKVYSKSYCPYCIRAKSLLESLDIPFEEIDITSTPEMMSEISEKSGMTTVPQIFVDDKCLGGFSELQKLDEDGKLEELCK